MIDDLTPSLIYIHFSFPLPNNPHSILCTYSECIHIKKSQSCYHLHILPLCTTTLHIHLSLYIQLFKAFLILLTPVHPHLSAHCSLYHCQFRGGGKQHLSLKPYTPTSNTHTCKNKLLVKFNYSIWEEQHPSMYVYMRPFCLDPSDYLKQPDWVSRRQVLFN